MPRKRIGLKITIVVAILAAICYAIFAYIARRAANEQIGLAKKEGMWTTPADILNRPKPPANQNAATIYQPLSKAFEADSDKRRVVLADVLKPEGEAKFEAAYRASQPYLDEFAKAAALPQCQFQRDWQNGAALLLPEYAQLKSAYTFVCTEASLMSKHGHPDAALDLIMKFAPMAHHVGTDPILISGFVQIAMDNITFRTLQEILGAHGREPGIPEKAMSVIDAIGAPPDAAGELKGEAASSMQNLDSPAELAGFFSENDRRLAMMARVPAVRDLWRADMMRFARRYHSALLGNHGDEKATIQAFRALDLSLAKNSVLSSLSLINGGWFQQFSIDHSRRNAIRSLIVGLEQWERTGNAPAALPSTGPDSIDPIINQPLHFAQIPGGFKVWGVDRDGVSHGGTAFDPKKEDNILQADILYQYPWKPPVVQQKPKNVGPPGAPPRVQGQINSAQVSPRVLKSLNAPNLQRSGP